MQTLELDSLTQLGDRGTQPILRHELVEDVEDLVDVLFDDRDLDHGATPRRQAAEQLEDPPQLAQSR